MATTYPLDPRSAAAAQVRATLQARESALRAEVEAARVRGRGDPARVSREVMDREERSRGAGHHRHQRRRDVARRGRVARDRRRAAPPRRRPLRPVQGLRRGHRPAPPRGRALRGALHRLPGQARSDAPAPRAEGRRQRRSVHHAASAPRSPRSTTRRVPAGLPPAEQHARQVGAAARSGGRSSPPRCRRPSAPCARPGCRGAR